jgi:hypothetical protein
MKTIPADSLKDTTGGYGPWDARAAYYADRWFARHEAWGYGPPGPGPGYAYHYWRRYW